MTIGSANPPPPSEGTGPGGEIDTAVPGGEAPAPWTPPAHWPPMPAGMSPDAVAHWIATHRQTDQLTAATEAHQQMIAESQKLQALLAAHGDERIELIFRTMEAVRKCPPV